MPKKRNTYWSRNKKEKQILTARLIEISIKVEDCIYKQKPISVCEAEKYMREVSSYKILCSRDERSLQVIEKLTRCMKAIIADHQELRSDYHTINNGSSIADCPHAGSISPVYSIPDEDRTLTQIAEAGPGNVTIANKDIEIIDLSHIDDDDDLMDNGPATVNYESSRMTVEVDIHRAMSSLSLIEVGDQLERPPTDANDSQSILKEFQGVNEVQLIDINIVPHDAVRDETVGSVTNKGKAINEMDAGEKNINNASAHGKTTGLAINPDKKFESNSATKQPIIAANSKNNLNFKTVLQKPFEVINSTNYGLTKTYQNDNTIPSKTFYPATNISESQRQTWYDSNRISTINDSSHTLEDANYITLVPKTIVKTAENLSVSAPNTFNEIKNGKSPNTIDTSKPLLNTVIVKENPTKKKRAPRKKKVIDENEIKPKNKRVSKALKSKKENTLTNSAKNKIIPIYNENVINDLSWVENIRFVREIGIDENDPKLDLEDSFWDNYYLPANWSDNEFV